MEVKKRNRKNERVNKRKYARMKDYNKNKKLERKYGWIDSQLRNKN